MRLWISVTYQLALALSSLTALFWHFSLTDLHEEAGMPRIGLRARNDDYVDFGSLGRMTFPTVEHEALKLTGRRVTTFLFNVSQGKLYAGDATDWYMGLVRAQHV